MSILLMSKTRSKLLAFLFSHSDENYYVRELGSLINEDPGNLSRELRQLEEEGLLRSFMKGRVKFYSVNKDYSLYPDLKSILFKTEGVEGSLRKLVFAHKGIDTAFIYGSFARGLEKKSSDIDLVIVGKFDRDKFTTGLRVLESKLKREINYTAYTKEEFEKERGKPGSFLRIVLKDKIIFLKGSINGR